MTSMLSDLYEPDQKLLTSQIAGRPGAGKSYFVKHTLEEYLKQNKDPMFRMVYFCPKNEMELKGVEIVGTDDLEKHLRKNRAAVVYPDPASAEWENDYCSDLLFELRGTNGSKFSAVYVIDDATTFITPRREPSDAMKRLVLTGRSKGVRAVMVAHHFVFNKIMEGSVENILVFGAAPKFQWGDAAKRYGLDIETHQATLQENPYSYLWYRVTKGTSSMFPALEVKKPKKRKKAKAKAA